MDRSYSRHNVFVGLFVFLGVMLLLIGTLVIGSINDVFIGKIELVSHFKDVNGLQSGNNIWYSGVKVGNISDIRFRGNSQIEVVMSIKKSIRKHIRKDAKVKIGSDGFIGNKILVIFGGTDSSPVVDKNDILEAEKTFSTDDILSTLQHNNENILTITSDLMAITQQLTNGQGSIGKFLKDSSLYDNANLVLLSLRETSATTQKLVASLNEFSQGLNKEGTLINDLVTDTVVFKSFKTSISNLQDVTDTAAVFISNLNGVIDNPNSMLGVVLHSEDAGDRLKGTMNNIEVSTEKLNDNLEALKHSFLFRRYFKRKEREKTENAHINK